MQPLFTRRQCLGGGLVFASSLLFGGKRLLAAAKHRKNSNKLAILPRSAWTTLSPDATLSAKMNGVRHVTVHHTGVAAAALRTVEQVKRQLRAIRDDHRKRGWADIGYHYAIDPAGRIWEARPATLQGAHVRGRNEHNLGVVLLGNFEVESPSAAALESLRRLLDVQLKAHSLKAGDIHTHRELAATLCPGRALQSYIDDARQSDVFLISRR